LCKPLRAAAHCQLVSILFDPWHTHSGFEICDQKSVILVDADVHLGHLDFVKARRQIVQRKRTFLVNLVSSNPVLEMVFDQGKMPLVSSTPSNWMISEKAFGELTRLSYIESTVRPSMTSKASKTTYVSSANKQTLFVSKSIRQTPRTNMQRSLWVLYNFYLDHEVILVRPFRIWAIYVFTLEEVFFLFFQPSPRFFGRSNQGLLRF